MDRFGDAAHDGADPAAAPGGPTEGVIAASDAFGRSLERWAAEATVDEAARARLRTHWLRIQSAESATLAGTLLDLAERGRPVVVEVGEHRVHGTLVGIGGDFVAMRADRGRHVVVRTSAIDLIRAEPGGVDVVGDRPPLLDLELDGVLGPLAAERPVVVVRTRTGATTRGQLRGAGTDVIRVRVDGEEPTPTWVPTAAIALVVIDP